MLASGDLEKRVWPKKTVIEQTIYEKFFDHNDKKLFLKFHRAESVAEQLSLCEQFNDPRGKEFAHRILLQENPANLPPEIIAFNQALIKERWESDGPWPSVAVYLNEAEELKQERTSEADQQILITISNYLQNNIERI